MEFRYKTIFRPIGLSCLPQGTEVVSVEPADSYAPYGYFTTAEPIEVADMKHFDAYEAPRVFDRPFPGQSRLEYNGGPILSDGDTKHGHLLADTRANRQARGFSLTI